MQAYYKERGNVGRNIPNVSVLFTQPSAGDRRVPYTRPLNTPLYRERSVRLRIGTKPMSSFSIYGLRYYQRDLTVHVCASLDYHGYARIVQ